VSRSEQGPVRMARVAVVATRSRRREAMVELADAGVVEVDAGDGARNGAATARRLLHDAPDDVRPRLARDEPDLEQLRRDGAWSRIAGEAELEERAADVMEHGPAAIVLGWTPEADVTTLAERLGSCGASVVALPRPRHVEPPTQLEGARLHRALRPLVGTYAVVPYEDVDPSLFAGITYVLMFGMMFGDVGHGLVLAGLGVGLARSRDPRLAGVRRLWPFPVAAGLVAAVFGLLYGEAFGPTGLVPTLWLSPLDQPIRLLAVAVGLGAVLIAASYVIGAVNRWREGGLRLALYAPTGIAGAVLFLGAAALAGGVAWQVALLRIGGGVVVALGLVLTFVGLRAEAGSGGAALGQATIELFDTVIRIFANIVSFGRLAAFGLTHAAIGFAVWEGTRALWGPGPRALAAVALFLVGNTVAFALEALVAGVQALRLEYYELFSRIFTDEGRTFSPWHVPVATEEGS
jgi:V/A-type H+-transporting ATPase subunit I